MALVLAIAGCTGAAAPAATSSPATSATSTPPAITTSSTTTTTRPCLPRYDAAHLLAMPENGAEPFITAGDFDGDGAPDVVVTRLRFQTSDFFPLEIYLNDGGALVEATPAIFVDTVPTVQHPAEVVVADFNGDGVDDIFVADTGRDLPPFPGYQNALALSAPGGLLVDGTEGLPQQRDYSHSAAAGDVDGDGDLDLYVGNVWGGERDGVGPQVWLNDGAGRFTVGDGRIPAGVADRDYGAYLTEAFADLDGDGDLDLVLGDAGDSLSGGPFSMVLRNDGAGYFRGVPGAMPPKENRSDLVHDIQVTDLDADGSPDLITVAQRVGGGSYLQVLGNLGDGRFEDVTAFRLDRNAPPVWIRALVLVDIDHDGDHDLLGKPWAYWDPDPILWINDGGRFVLTPHEFGLDDLYFDFIDWSGDGGIDLIESGFTLLAERPCN